MLRLIPALTALLAVLSAGCISTRVADLTLAANRNVPVSLANSGKVKGRSCTWLNQIPSLEEALDRAQEKAPGANALTNVDVTYYVELWVLLSKKCFIVEAEAVTIGAEGGGF